MLEFADAIKFVTDFVGYMEWPERISTLTGLIYIVLSVRQNPLCWPFGIISVGIWMVVVFLGRMYMDSLLNFVYVLLGFYGWYQWMRGGKDNTPLEVRTVSRQLWIKLAAIGVASTIPLGLLSQHVLNAAFPWWDTITTVISLIAQYLLAKKYLENWLLWVVADAIYIWLYIAKGWHGYSMLMAVYTFMAVLGFVSWWRSIRTDRTTA